MQRRRVVIVGAGFGGVQCARALAGKPVDVTIIDRDNFHLFTPLLYQVASSLLNPSDIAHPVRSIFRRRSNVRFRLGHVQAIDLERRAVRLDDGGELPYDYLVVAAGSTTNYFGNLSVQRQSFGLKNLPESLELRNHILRILEMAARTTDEAERRRLLSFVIVGGGPTGVEYAGALYELVRLVIPDEYPELSTGDVRITLVEGMPRVLPAFPEELGEEAERELRRRGIEVVTGTLVKEANEGGVVLSDGSSLGTGTVVWAAGVRPSPIAEDLGVERSRSGRLVVDGALRLKGRTREYAVGDIASFVVDGAEVPMLAAPAMQQGRSAARNILRDIAGEPLRRFRYADRGSMATIGRNSAVASVGRVRLTGFAGWVVWLVVHLYYIIGFRNRAAVLLGWAWNYIRSDRPVRIIARARAGVRPIEVLDE